MEAREGPFRLGVQSSGFRRGSPFSIGKAASFAVRKAGIAPLLLKGGAAYERANDHLKARLRAERAGRSSPRIDPVPSLRPATKRGIERIVWTVLTHVSS